MTWEIGQIQIEGLSYLRILDLSIQDERNRYATANVKVELSERLTTMQQEAYLFRSS